MRHPSFPLLLLCLLLFGFARPALTAPAEFKVTLQAEAGYEGLAKADRWIPVRVTLTNEGPELNGLLQFETRIDLGLGPERGVQRYPVLLPAGATKQVELLMPTHLGSAPEIGLWVGAEQVAQVRPRLGVTPDILIGVLGVEPAELSSLSGISFGAWGSRLVRLAPDRMPTEPLALGSLDLILLDRFAWSELPARQQAAIQAWVEHGGRLVVAGGPEAGRAQTLFPWIGLEPLGVEEVQLEGIGTARLLRFAEAGWQVTERIGGQAVAALRLKGAGAIHLLAFDPALEPFASWVGLQPLLQRSLMSPLIPGAALGESRVFAISGPATDDPFEVSPVRAVPEINQLLYLLGAYALLIGPVHLLLLKSCRRVGLALITLPLLTLAGVGVAGAHLQRSHGAEVPAFGLGVVEGQVDGSWLRVRSFYGLFPPPDRGYRLEAGGALLLSHPSVPLNRPEVPPISSQGSEPVTAGRSLQVRSLDSWHMRGMSVDGILPIPATVEGNLVLEGTNITGVVTNRLPFPIYQALLIVGEQFQRLGDLAPGQSVEVLLGVRNPNPDFMGLTFGNVVAQAASQIELDVPAAARRRLRGSWWLADSLPWADPAAQPHIALAGWLDQSPFPVTIDGRSLASVDSLLYAQPMRYTISDDTFTLPNHFISSRVIGTDGLTVSKIRLGPTAVTGTFTMEHTIPAHLVDRVTELDLRIPQGGSGRLKVDLFQWDEATWVEHPDTASVIQGDPARFISSEGQVRSRISLLDSEPGWRIDLPMITVRGKAVER